MDLITGWGSLGVDPGEVRPSSVEVVLKGVNECGKKRAGCSLQVCLTDRILSTQRLPFSLAVPRERFRHSTPKRRIRSA